MRSGWGGLDGLLVVVLERFVDVGWVEEEVVDGGGGGWNDCGGWGGLVFFLGFDDWDWRWGRERMGWIY
jgi:hypothetical protein